MKNPSRFLDSDGKEERKKQRKKDPLRFSARMGKKEQNKNKKSIALCRFGWGKRKKERKQAPRLEIQCSNYPMCVCRSLFMNLTQPPSPEYMIR